MIKTISLSIAGCFAALFVSLWATSTKEDNNIYLFGFYEYFPVTDDMLIFDGSVYSMTNIFKKKYYKDENIIIISAKSYNKNAFCLEYEAQGEIKHVAIIKYAFSLNDMSVGDVRRIKVGDEQDYLERCTGTVSRDAISYFKRMYQNTGATSIRGPNHLSVR